MSKIHGFPKIWHVGNSFIPNLFIGNVEVTEKIDGSQFGFGIAEDGELVCRSKGKEMILDAPEKMFSVAVKWVIDNEALIRSILRPGDSIYGEFMGSPSHNILKYARTPANNVIVFGASLQNAWINKHAELSAVAAKLGLEAVPLLYHGEIKDFEQMKSLLETDSILGNVKIEGMVFKNYEQPCFLGNIILPSFGKFVSESFKEAHASDWGPKFKQADHLQALIDSYRTEARWHKAIQHLREKGELTDSPKDIGNLMKEIERDLAEEEKENIKAKLWQLHKDQFFRKAQAGFPVWYKDELAKKQFQTVSV